VRYYDADYQQFDVVVNFMRPRFERIILTARSPEERQELLDYYTMAVHCMYAIRDRLLREADRSLTGGSVNCFTTYTGHG